MFRLHSPLLALALLLAACAPDVEVTPIAKSSHVHVYVDRSTYLGTKLERQYGDRAVPCGDQPASRCREVLFRTFDDPETVAALFAFANDRSDGFVRDPDNPSLGRATVFFIFDPTIITGAGFIVGGSGGDYFIGRDSDFGPAYRRLSLDDVATLASLIGCKAEDIFRP